MAPIQVSADLRGIGAQGSALTGKLLAVLLSTAAQRSARGHHCACSTPCLPPQWIVGQISRVSALQTKSFVLTISLSGLGYLICQMMLSCVPQCCQEAHRQSSKWGGEIFTHLSKQVASPARCHVPDPPQRLALLLSCCCLRTGAGLEWCPIMCSSPPFPSIWNSLGFFPLTSIAYRRVIRVYQYEVGDDLSGRFILLIFLNSLCSLVVFFPTAHS